MVVSKYGISFNGGKDHMTWEQYIEVLKLFVPSVQLVKIKDKIRELTEYSDLTFNQQIQQEVIEWIARDLGINPTKTIPGTKARIRSKLEKLRKDNLSDVAINHRI